MRHWPYLLLIPLCATLLYTYSKERIPVNGGLGWDGRLFGAYTANFPAALEAGQINSYRFHRILVPAALYYVMSTLDIPPTSEHIIRAFQISNGLFILIGALLFLWLARLAHWKPWTTAIGFSALFFTVPVLKLSMFYALMPDIPALTFGILAVLCWYAGWRAALLLAILAGAFVAPTMVLFAGLLLFPKEDLGKGESLPWWAFGILPLLYIGLLFYIRSIDPAAFTMAPAYSQIVHAGLLPLAIGIGSLYLFGMTPLLGSIPRKPDYWKNLPWVWWGLAALVLACIQGIIQFGAGGETPPQTSSSYLKLLVVQSLTYPGSFLAAHFQYIPGVLALGLLAIPFLRREASRQGLGAILMAAGVLALHMGTESRQLLQLVPFLLFLFLEAFNRNWDVKPWFGALAVLSLWLSARWWADLSKAGNIDPPYLTFPSQHYFRFQGPWMAYETMAFSLLTLALSVGFLGLLWKMGALTLVTERTRKTKKA